MRILVTNDDGIDSPGLRALADALKPLGEVWIVAPDRERTAVAHAVTLHKPLRLHRLAPRTFSVNGTPVDCVNLALLNATTTFKDRTSVSVAVDYRQSPLLTSNNALIGQTITSILDLETIYGADGLYQLAADRSATSKTVTVSVAHPFNEKFSLNADATVSNIGPTPASGGVAAVPSTGTEEYLSAQLIGSGLLKQGDLGIVGFRFANTAVSYRYILDLNTRYPISRALRVNPRLILSYRDNKVTPGTEFSTKPSIRVNYYFHKHYQLEIESGGEWTVDRSPVSHDTTLGYYLNMGVRADF